MRRKGFSYWHRFPVWSWISNLWSDSLNYKVIRIRFLHFRLLAAFWWVSEKVFLALACFYWFLGFDLLVWFFGRGEFLACRMAQEQKQPHVKRTIWIFRLDKKKRLHWVQAACLKFPQHHGGKSLCLLDFWAQNSLPKESGFTRLKYTVINKILILSLAYFLSCWSIILIMLSLCSVGTFFPSILCLPWCQGKRTCPVFPFQPDYL